MGLLDDVVRGAGTVAGMVTKQVQEHAPQVTGVVNDVANAAGYGLNAASQIARASIDAGKAEYGKIKAERVAAQASCEEPEIGEVKVDEYFTAQVQEPEEPESQDCPQTFTDAVDGFAAKVGEKIGGALGDNPGDFEHVAEQAVKDAYGFAVSVKDKFSEAFDAAAAAPIEAEVTVVEDE